MIKAPNNHTIVRRVLSASLRTKTIMAFLLITLIPVGILAYLNIRSTESALIESANLTLFAAASRTATAIDNFINTKVDVLYNKSLSPALSRYCELPPEQRKDSTLERVVTNTLVDRSYRGFDSQYTSYTLFDVHGTSIFDNRFSIGRDEPSYPYFQRALQAGRPYISPVEYPDKKGTPDFYISSPVHHSPEENAFKLHDIVGVIRLTVSVSALQRLVEQSRNLAGENSFAMLLDEHHIFLAHSADSKLLFRAVGPVESTQVQELQAARRLPDLPLETLVVDLPLLKRGLQQTGDDRFFTARTRLDTEQLDQIVMVKLGTRPWVVAFAQSREEFLIPVKAQTRIAVAVAAGIVVIVSALAVGIAELLTIPISRLTAVAERVSAGDLTAEVDVDGQDEIGKLGRTFNTMTVRLRQSLDELKQHHDHLEELVAARTTELLTANAQLRQEIAERKRIERELQQAKDTALEAQRRAEAAQRASEAAQKVAETASRAKSEFLARMSHELRTPLNAILGFVYLLLARGELRQKQHEYLRIINRSGEHLLSLINQVLDLSKFEAGEMPLNERTFDLFRLLEGVEELFRIQAEERELSLSFECAPEVPRYVRSDDVKLRQVLINLLNNAIKFTKKGSVTVRIENCRLNIEKCQETAPDLQSSIVDIQFSITDTGPGIAEEEIPHLFEAFTQTRAGQESREGSGLGLTISQKFIHSMGGNITVDTAVGRGTTFMFVIPVEIVNKPGSEMGVYHGPDKMTAAHQRVLTFSDLAALPVELRLELQEAVEGINLSSAYSVIKQIRQHNVPVADTLATLVSNYRFDILQNIFEKHQ